MVRTPLLGACLTTLAALSVGSPASPGQAPALPAAIRAELSAAYPGYRFARLHPGNHSELSAEPGNRRSAEWVSGDYNGDRRTDYVVQIVRPAPADSSQLVIVFLAGAASYDRFVLHAVGEHLGIYLRTAPRGERVLDLDKDINGGTSFVLLNDAVDILFTEGAGMTCLYETRAWRCVLSGD
jgi:hypothetical protein